ncbi:uncharacterized protein LOC129250229 [Anastrepha obliqua]|uniref:uncharacterized protein LOC129250229 n=1 Tax=Anastrepha obliqua TaxID=95512 RepID=UPI00240A73BF|nr:uncharacterized protein LOC129250229 [Anastrepha obliqua]
MFGEFDTDLDLLSVYVDDLLIASREPNLIHKFMQQLLNDFDIKDVGKANYCHGLEIHQENDVIILKQMGYILELLRQYGMIECNPVATPPECNTVFDKSCERLDKTYPYREIIGALKYLSVATRPDIANTVARLAQFVYDRPKAHWNAIKRVLRYLADTASKGLVYQRTALPLVGYTDADWSGCTNGRRSYTGYAYLLSNAAISWKSQKQRTVAHSSTEAEYVSLTEAAKEAVYLRSLLRLALKSLLILQYM